MTAPPEWNTLPVLVLFLILILVPVPCTAVPSYQIRSGYASPPPPSAVPVAPEEVPVWELPLGVIATLVVAFPLEILVSLKLWAALGYRRVFGSNVLANDTRSAVFSAIRENPGIHLHGLAREAKIGMGTLRHHLDKLLTTGKITGRHDTATVRFYENDGTYSAAEQVVLKHLRNETRKKILALLLKTPAAGRNEIARMLGMTGSTITWHMKILEEDGVISPRREGKNIVYAIPDEMQICLWDLLPAP